MFVGLGYGYDIFCKFKDDFKVARKRARIFVPPIALWCMLYRTNQLLADLYARA